MWLPLLQPFLCLPEFLVVDFTENTNSLTNYGILITLNFENIHLVSLYYDVTKLFIELLNFLITMV